MSQKFYTNMAYINRPSSIFDESGNKTSGQFELLKTDKTKMMAARSMKRVTQLKPNMEMASKTRNAFTRDTIFKEGDIYFAQSSTSLNQTKII